MNDSEDPVAAAYIEACLAELDAPKPGNVHRFAPGHRMEVADFVRSAEASAAPIAARGARVGVRVRAAVDATLVGGRSEHQSRHHPLVRAARGGGGGPAALCARRWRGARSVSTGRTRRTSSAAIAAANPGGLGRAPRHDVNAPAAATLREAMAEAAERDRIARQYVTTYEDIFSLGLPALATARRRQSDARWSTLAVYLTFLAAMPDTHIVRKFDAATAEAVRREAADWRDAFAAARDPEGIADGLLSWDAELKSRGINPGTSADLTVATLFASSLSAIRDDKCAAAILPLRANDA